MWSDDDEIDTSALDDADLGEDEFSNLADWSEIDKQLSCTQVRRLVRRKCLFLGSRIHWLWISAMTWSSPGKLDFSAYQHDYIFCKGGQY